MNGLESPKPEAVGAVSEAASRAFAGALPRLLTLVNDKFSVNARLFSRTSPERLALVIDAHQHFGDMLRAVFEFSLYENMLDEMIWYVSALSSRGLGGDYFRKMVEAWIIAVHAAIPAREARELSRPLEWLASNLSAVYARKEAAEGPTDSRVLAFLDIVLAKKRRGALDYALNLKRGGQSVERILTGVVLPAMAEVGRLWEANEISVSDEHAATEICRYALQMLTDELPRGQPLGLRAVVGCVPGEQHDVGAMLTAAFLETKGWDVVYLGRSMPERDLLKTVAEERPAVSVFSITLIAHLPASRDLFLGIRQTAPGTKIIAGGHASEVASRTLASYVDAVVGGIYETHEAALKLVGRNA